ncbi:MAG: EamA family transporter [Anaerolineae bacterium]|nr:EamA family transporter [Anaerolineae bacterium]
MNLLDLFVLLILGLIWGSSFLFIKVGVAEMPPATVGAARLAIAMLFLLLVMRARRLSLPGLSLKDSKSLRLWRDIAIVAFFNNTIPFILIPWGEQYITSSLASILNATMPIFTVLVAHFFTSDDHFTLGKVGGILLGFFGVIVLIGPDLSDLRQTRTQGELAVIASSISYAIATTYARKHLRGQQPVVLAGAQLTLGFLWTLPFALLTAHFAAVPSWQAVGAVGALGLVGTGVAYLFYYWLLVRNSATFVSLVTYLLPVTAVLWGAALLQESLGAGTFLGLALICVGIALVNGTVGVAVRWAGARLGWEQP